MTDALEMETRAVMTKLEWGVLISICASSASLIFTAGVVWTTLQLHDKEINQLQSADHDQVDRLARIETKLDLILDGGKKSRR